MKEFIVIYILTAPFVFWIYELTRVAFQRREGWGN